MRALRYHGQGGLHLQHDMCEPERLQHQVIARKASLTNHGSPGKAALGRLTRRGASCD